MDRDDARIDHLRTLIDKANDLAASLLTWATLTDDQRRALTEVSNLLEMSHCHMGVVVGAGSIFGVPCPECGIDIEVDYIAS